MTLWLTCDAKGYALWGERPEMCSDGCYALDKAELKVIELPDAPIPVGRSECIEVRVVEADQPEGWAKRSTKGKRGK